MRFLLAECIQGMSFDAKSVHTEWDEKYDTT